MSAPRRWARRAMVSLLAGSGLTAAGFGGPLAGGALGAEGTTGTTSSTETPPPVTETTPQAPAPEPSSSEPSTTTSTTPTPSSTSTAPAASAPPSPSPAPTASGSAPSAGASEAPPTVVVQRKQQATRGVSRNSTQTSSGASGSGEAGAGGQGAAGANGAAGEGPAAANGGPSNAPAGAPNGVAPAPLAAGGEAGALSTLLAGSAVSAQALDFYRIPLFLLPVYQAAAFQYDVPWQILAAINEVETDYGSDLSVSTAGAVGWMQFMPSTWLQYGVDATNAGYADPYNPVDAIFAAARYLHAAGAPQHLRAAILAYNHSQEYLESVLLRARLIASYPSAVIGTLTGLVDGRAPTVDARLSPATGAGPAGAPTSAGAGSVSGAEGPPSSSSATAGAVPTGTAPTPAEAGALAGTAAAPTGTPPASGAQGADGNTAQTAAAGGHGAASVPGSKPPPSPQVVAKRAQAAANAPAKASQLVDILGAPDAPVVAVEDGRIEHLGHSHSLGRYLVLRDIYGDVFTYAGLGSIAPRYHPTVPKVKRSVTAAQNSTGAQDPVPTQPATAGHQLPLTLRVRHHAAAVPTPSVAVEAEGEAVPPGMGRVRLYAHPENPIARTAARRAAKSADATGGGWLALRTGSVVTEGTVLGHLATPAGASAGQLRFAVRPSGDSGTIDPQALLANWRQLGTALHPKGSKGSAGTLLGATAEDALLMSKGELERTVLADPGIQLDGCGRRDVASGTIDKRVLGVLEFLSRSGLQPTVAALRCPRGGEAPTGLSLPSNTGARAATSASSGTGAAGDVASHYRGTAVDITAINGIPIAAHQGPGSVTDAVIRTLLTLRGEFAPQRIVSLMRYPEAPTTAANSAAWDHIHIEFPPRRAVAHTASAGPAAASPLAVTGDLNEAQWSELIGRIAALPKPTVAAGPSSAAIRDPQAAPTNRGLGAGGPSAGG
jgi:hypothetical protein